MATLGEKKQLLLNQVRSNVDIPLEKLVELITKYDDLEPEDFRGYIDDRQLEQLIVIFLKINEEKRWEQIVQQYPCSSNSETIHLIEDYIRDYPCGSRINEALQIREEITSKEIRSKIDLQEECRLKPPPVECQSREESHIPRQTPHLKKSMGGYFTKLLKKISQNSRTLCNSAVFAPAKIARGGVMLVQVYIYKDEETESIVVDAQMSDEEAVRRSYCPLYFKIKKGDRITVNLNMHDLSIDGEDTQSIVWQNRYTKCGFFVPVPSRYNGSKVIGDVYISVNGLEFGKMSFFSKVSSYSDTKDASQVEVLQYKKIFISYSHKDKKIAKAIAEAYRALNSIDYFYDRHSLSPGDRFEKKVFDYIDNCDLFILCWSKNAEGSKWVKKERTRAIIAALEEPPRIRLYPISILPHAAPPQDMIESFHFEDYKA